MTQDELYRKAYRIVAGRRQQAVTDAYTAQSRAHAMLPQLEALQSEITLSGIRAAKLAAVGASSAETEHALAQSRALHQQREELLRSAGFSANALAPQYTCPLCSDTGRIDGRVCTCVQALVRSMRQAEVNETSPLSLCSFETFDLGKYPETMLPECGTTVRAQMTQIFDYCVAYAQHFSRANGSLYLCGFAGLGKTHLALSIANAVLAKGFDVVYVSAQDAFDRMEKERFGAEGNTLRTLESAELLILDDLGTEFITPYVSACLYSVINTRCNRRLPTIYTSNIVKDADLRRRYTEKIVSRLLGSCEVLTFCGEDIRLMNK
ncbi:MAG: ATP-binding protein [Ruthenibacterium sp.]